MTELFVVIAAAALGVEAGWEPLPDGGHEYTIQIEPALVGRLQAGNDLISEIPSQVTVRRFRITLGTGSLARIDSPEPTTLAEPADAPPLGDPIDGVFSDGVPSDDVFSGGGSVVSEAPDGGIEDSLAAPAARPDSFGRLDVAPPSDGEPAAGMTDSAVPANFDQAGEEAQPLDGAAEPADAAQPSSTATRQSTEKPRLAADTAIPGAAGATPAEQPWLPFVVAAVMLACSLGANLYLGWIAWDARSRYRDAINKWRPAPSA